MKSIKRLVIGLVVILVVIGLCVLSNEEKIITVNKSNENVTENKVNKVQNKTENVVTNKVENKIENKIENTGVNNNTVQNIVQNEMVENKVNNTTTNPQTPKENNDQKAINMVKQDWGEDASVTFKIDEKKENGKYVVSVVDKNTTAVLVWYDVDVKNNTIQVR